MPSIPLPEHPSLEHLQQQAKLVRDLVREVDDGALGLVAEFHPRHIGTGGPAGDDAAGFKLADAQLVVARLYGFGQWADLRRHLDQVDHYARSPGSSTDTEPELEAAADRFVALACLDYGSEHPLDRLRRARAMLDADPALAAATPWAAATVGAVDALREALGADPALVGAEVGPHRWPLLLYCCYSRVFLDRDVGGSSGEGSEACVRLLLEQGADPNAGFLWNGLVPPFTALTGVLGRGEQDQSPHPRSLHLARLLLEAGADPNDGQALYNNGLAGAGHDDPAFLELLVAFGLGTDTGGPWYRRLGRQLTAQHKLLIDELEVAAMGRPRRMRFLAGLGLDLEQAVGRSGLSPVRIAARGGHREVLAVLDDAGVNVSLTPDERFLMAAKSGTAADLVALAEADPDLVDRIRTESPGLIAEIASLGRLPTVRELLHRGFGINALSPSGKTPLHKAAIADDAELISALVELGADPDLPDAHIGADPLGWARHSGNQRAIAVLAPITGRGDGVDPIDR